MIIDTENREELVQQYILAIMHELKVKNISALDCVSEFLKDYEKMVKNIAEIKKNK